MSLKLRSYIKVSQRQVSTSSVPKAVVWPKPAYGPMEVQRSQLMNGIKVAAAKPLGAPMAACTIMYQAGSRYEVGDQLGACHFMRAASTSSGCGYTAFAKMRVLQQHGCFLTCSADRQSIAFTLRGPLTSFPDMKYYLLDAASRCCYHQWEMEDRKPLIHDDLDRISPEARVLDLLQTASWRGPLANSIYCPEDRIDSMTGDTLNCFASTNFKTDECTVASYGVPFEETMKMAEMIEYRTDKPPPRKEMCSCPRPGFECHDLGAGADTWVALAVPGCGTLDALDLLKHNIVASACGTGDTARGQHALDRTPMAPLGTAAASDACTHYRAFNISYRDAGLFGILAKSRSCSAWEVSRAAAQFLAAVGDLSFKQIEVGKARLQLSLARHDEDCVRVCEGLALQLANGVQIDTAKNALGMIDLICSDDVCCTAKTLSCKYGAMSMAVAGDVGAVPLDCELRGTIS